MATVFGNRWEIIQSVGEGGQAHAFRVRDTWNDSTNWILKRLKNRERLARFRREIEALNDLKSPHIPQTEDYSIDDPAYHVSRDLGISLAQYSKPIQIDWALILFKQIASAVRDAHEIGVIHRDIKPNNIIVSLDGTKAYLIDFGICQYADSKLTLLTTVEAFGNPAFSAPECFLGREEEPGSACDIYSLGKIFYWIISNGNHINRERITAVVLNRIAVNNEVTRFYLARLVRNSVVEEPRKRWSAGQLLDEIEKTIKLVKRIRTFEEHGQTILMDGFGLNDSFNTSSFKSATTPNRGNPPGYQDIGTAFEIPPLQDYHLDTITLALGHHAGRNEIEISISPDLDGKPDASKTLETFRISGVGAYPPRIEFVQSQKQPILYRGERYWILLSVLAPDSEVSLWGAPIDFMPRPALIAKRRDRQDWTIGKSASGPGYAIRVTGRALHAN